MEEFLKEILHRGALLGIKIFWGLVVFAAFWIGSTVFQRTIRRLYDKAEPGRQDAVHLISQAAKIGILAFGAVTALGTMSVDVSALVAGLGLTGFALGFALKDILSNLVAGLLILFYRPFKRYDQISVTGFEGRVTEIDLRYTTLEAEDKKFLIPNSTLFTNPISLLVNQEQDKVPKGFHGLQGAPKRNSSLRILNSAPPSYPDDETDEHVDQGQDDRREKRGRKEPVDGEPRHQ